ncbi:MAG: hypothetical protein LBS52_00170 [Dysgonamonadaceae bacterium]|jgi:hypothetical protein|nr:hypothetical protein [Dysgonamonadaceae bacterium]
MGKQLLVKRILEGIPSYVKPISYLMDTLDLGRESAYRRLRGEIPFTFEEVSKLSVDLDFSVDEIINEGKTSRTHIDFLLNHPEPDVSFSQMFRKYIHIVSHVSENEEAEMFASLNRLPLYMISTNDILFKFHYVNYRYRLLGNDALTAGSFLDVNLPSDVISIRDKFLEQMQRINEFRFIVSRSLFLNICREVQYFYNRKFISDEELEILQNTLHNLVETMRETVRTGRNDLFNTQHIFYLSYMDISANSSCVMTKNDIVSQFWIYGAHFIEVRNSEVCYMYKEWFEYLKKYSVMISISNEMYQIKFFDLQHRYIDNIVKDFSYFE